MKIILPVVNDDNLKNKVADGFHNSKFVCIYDTDKIAFKWMETSKLCDKPGNLGIELKRNGIQAVISPEMPLMALGLFAEMGLKVYKARDEEVNENINLLLSNNLEKYTIQSALGLSTCSSSCSSCSSSCN